MELGKSLDVPECQCPSCGKQLNRVTGVDASEAPKPEDITICAGCAAVLKFDDQMKVVALSQEEMLALPTVMKAEIRFAQSVVRDMHAGKRLN
jgi:hypothetical protein